MFDFDSLAAARAELLFDDYFIVFAFLFPGSWRPRPRPWLLVLFSSA
jgi:hypothetical protein